METLEQAIVYMATIWVVLSFLRKGLTYLPSRIADKIEGYICPKCITFWATLLITQDIAVAAIGALIAAVMDNILSTHKL